MLCHPDLQSYILLFPQGLFQCSISWQYLCFWVTGSFQGMVLWYLHLWYNNHHCSAAAPVSVQRVKREVKSTREVADRLWYSSVEGKGGDSLCLGLQPDSTRSSNSLCMKEKPFFVAGILSLFIPIPEIQSLQDKSSEIKLDNEWRRFVLSLGLDLPPFDSF